MYVRLLRRISCYHDVYIISWWPAHAMHTCNKPSLTHIFQVFDMQCWHCLRDVHGDAASAWAVAALVREGGALLTLCGNANEPPCGPATVTGMQLYR